MILVKRKALKLTFSTFRFIYLTHDPFLCFFMCAVCSFIVLRQKTNCFCKVLTARFHEYQLGPLYLIVSRIMIAIYSYLGFLLSFIFSLAFQTRDRNAAYKSVLARLRSKYHLDTECLSMIVISLLTKQKVHSIIFH